MSMMRCETCDKTIDTDFDAEHFDECCRCGKKRCCNSGAEKGKGAAKDGFHIYGACHGDEYCKPPSVCLHEKQTTEYIAQGDKDVAVRVCEDCEKNLEDPERDFDLDRKDKDLFNQNAHL